MAIKKPLNISRRDLLNGVPLMIGAGLSSNLLSGCAPTGESPSARAIMNSVNYPPGEMGMRGSHEGSYEVAHQLAWQGETWATPDKSAEPDYDVIIVGAGISGLAAAYFYRQKFGADKRVLLLDNHDDFGGHAKRNEFDVDGRLLIGYGGSQSIDNPASNSAAAQKMFDDIGLAPNRFYDYYDRSFFASRGLKEKVFFDRANYGQTALAESVIDIWQAGGDPETISAAINSYPLSDAGRTGLFDLLTKPRDYLEGQSIADKRDVLRTKSYEQFLLADVRLSEDAVILLRKEALGIWGMGWDAMSAIEAMRMELPGLSELGFTDIYPTPSGGEEPRVFHFPDGNAGLTRLMVRHLIPQAMSGETMEDVVTAQTDYDALDQDDRPTKIRLSATVVKVENNSNGDGVKVTYVKGGAASLAMAQHVIMAGYGHMVPFLCPEVSAAQAEAFQYPERTPLVYVNVAVRNWRAFEAAGTHRLYAPKAFFNTMRLDFPVSMGDYTFTQSSDEPTVLTLQYIPIVPGQGLNRKEQSRAGRYLLYQLTFAEFEQKIVEEMTEALGPFGFDAEADITGITVNRWPHGYAYEYNEFEDDWSFDSETGPHILARQPIGNIHIASSDSHASAYASSAIDAAERAINEIAQS